MLTKPLLSLIAIAIQIGYVEVKTSVLVFNIHAINLPLGKITE